MNTRRYRGAALACLLVFTGWAGGVRAQQPTAGEEELTLSSAPVLVDGVALFHVAGTRILPAPERAARIADRLAAVAADASLDPASLRIEEDPESTVVAAGTRPVVRLVDADARLEGITRRLLAEIVTQRIREAIARYRADRRPATLLRNGLAVAGWGVVLGFALWATYRILARLRRRMEERYQAHLREVRIQSFSLVTAHQIRRLVSGLVYGALALGALAALLIYLRFALGRFPWTRELGLTLADATLRPVVAVGTGILNALPNLLFLVVLALVVRYVLRVIRLFFDSIAEGRVVFRGFDAEWALATYRLVRVLVVVLAVVIAYPYIPGSSSDAFKGISLFIGVLFSLGSSSIIGNMLAGLTMTYRRAFRVGDRVKIGEHIGAVEQVRMMVTHLRTPKNEEVIVPNSMILASEVTNYSAKAASDGLILHTTVGIGYETPWRQVEAMLLEAAARVPGLRKDPAPFVLQRALGDFAVTYEINAYCGDAGLMLALYSELHANILDVFNEYGIQIMTPAYEGDPEIAKVVPKAQWYAAPARPPAAGAGAGSEAQLPGV